jgi:hypothetical protein
VNPATQETSFASSEFNEQASIVDLPRIGNPIIATINTPDGPVQALEAYWQKWFLQVYRAIFHLHFTDHAYNEVPAGAVDGANKVFTLADPPNVPESLQLFVAGLLLNPATDYTLSNETITFTTAPVAGATILAFYQK